MRSAHLLAGLALLVFPGMTLARPTTPYFQELGTAQGFNGPVYPNAISNDGTIVVGAARGLGPGSFPHAFQWTALGGVQRLNEGNPPPFQSTAVHISADGSTVVGGGLGLPGTPLYRWTSAGLTILPPIPGTSYGGQANSASADGAIVVGMGAGKPDTSGASGSEAFRWTATEGTVGLGDLPGGRWESSALSVSADGSTIVGRGESATGTEAVRWTNAGIVSLGDLPGGASHSVAVNVSGDGSVVVGIGTSALGSEAFRWTEAEGMIGLGSLSPEAGSEGIAISDDGRYIVGSSDGRAFLWDQQSGMRDLNGLLGAQGLLPTGWKMEYASDVTVTPEGLVTVVGYGRDEDGLTRGFVAAVPEPTSIAALALGGLALLRRRKVR